MEDGGGVGPSDGGGEDEEEEEETLFSLLSLPSVSVTPARGCEVTLVWWFCWRILWPFISQLKNIGNSGYSGSEYLEVRQGHVTRGRLLPAIPTLQRSPVVKVKVPAKGQIWLNCSWADIHTILRTYHLLAASFFAFFSSFLTKRKFSSWSVGPKRAL